LLDDTIVRLGYRRYLVEDSTQVGCSYPVVGTALPGGGIFLLDIVLDELGLGRQHVITPFPLSKPARFTEAVPLNLISMFPNSYAAAQELFEGIKRNNYILGSIPFSTNGLEIVNRNGFKKIVMVRDRRDAAVALAGSLRGVTYPLSKYFRSLPGNSAFLMAVIKGVTPLESGPDNGSLAGINQMVEHIDKWSNQPDTLTVTYEQLVGEAGGGTKTNQIAAVTAMCVYLGIELTASAIEGIVENINRRITYKVKEGYIGQWQDYFSKEHLEAIEI
jgi:hypothetical protein